MDVKRLRALSENVERDKAEAARTADAAIRASATAQERTALDAERQRATQVIGQIPEILDREARRGMRTASVYTVSAPFVKRWWEEKFWSGRKLRWSVPDFAIDVFRWCEREGLSPKWVFEEKPKIPWEAAVGNHEYKAKPDYWATLVVTW